MSDDAQDFTPAQKQAMERAFNILEEHFKAGIISVVADSIKEDDENSELRGVRWFGGACCAIGLCKKAELELTREDDEDAGPN